MRGLQRREDDFPRGWKRWFSGALDFRSYQRWLDHFHPPASSEGPSSTVNTPTLLAEGEVTIGQSHGLKLRCTQNVNCAQMLPVRTWGAWLRGKQSGQPGPRKKAEEAWCPQQAAQAPSCPRRRAEPRASPPGPAPPRCSPKPSARS